MKHMLMPLLCMGMMSLTGCGNMSVNQAGNVAIPQVYSLGETVQLQIESRRVACQSTVPMQCLQATDVANQREFLIWYNGIDGFDHANGFQYVINAKPLTKAPQHDPSSQQWTLVDIVSQTPTS